MSQNLLEHLHARTAFSHYLGLEELGGLHVPFEELIEGSPVETRVKDVLGKGGRAALIGPSGSGKSSVVSYLLFVNTTAAIAPLVIPMSAVSTEMVLEPALVAGQMILTLTRAAAEMHLISAEEYLRAIGETNPSREFRLGRDVTARVAANFGVLSGELGTDLARQLVVSVSIAPEEKLEVLHQILGTIENAGLSPVLIFDDTDRWLGGRGLEDPNRVVEGFFGRALRWIASLDCAILVAVHKNYFDFVPRPQLLEVISTPVDIPALPSREALSRVIERRIGAVTDGSPFESSSVIDLLDQEAMDLLFSEYQEGEPQLRDIIKILHIALTSARDSGSESISAAAVASSIAAEYG